MSEANKKWTEYKKALEEIDEQESLLKQRFEAIQQTQTTIQSLQSEIQKKHSSLDAIQQYVQKLTKENDEHQQSDGDVKKEKKKLKELQKEFDDLNIHREEMLYQQQLLDMAKIILKDDGIKTRIIKQYLPIMNKLINKYLHEMDFFVSFHLDENFDETIKSRYRDDFTYASFSEGEKMRIDLALLFDSSLDSEGTDSFLKIMYEMGSTTNVFVISHKGDQLYDKFRSILKFEKKKNFSQIAA